MIFGDMIRDAWQSEDVYQISLNTATVDFIPVLHWAQWRGAFTADIDSVWKACASNALQLTMLIFRC